MGIIKSINFLDSATPSTYLSQPFRPSNASASSNCAAPRTPMFFNTSPARTSSSPGKVSIQSSSTAASIPSSSASNSNDTPHDAAVNNTDTLQPTSINDLPLIEYNSLFRNSSITPSKRWVLNA